MTLLCGIFGFLLTLSGGLNALREHTNGRANLATLYAALGLFGVGLFITPIVVQARSPKPNEVKPAIEASEPPDARGTAAQQAILVAAGEEAARNLLKDPWSAQFKYSHVHVKNGFAAVCGAVNAKGGFGTYTGWTRYVSLGATSNTAIDNNGYEFGNYWRRFCER